MATGSEIPFASAAASRGSAFWQGKRVLMTGASGFVGSNLRPRLAATGCELICPSRRDYDLLEQAQVRRMFADTRPHLVLHLAGLIGGILANKERPADFAYQNLLMGTLMLHEAWRAGAQKYVTLMGGCSYPAVAPSPIKETELWKGYPQPESAPYSLGKAMGSVQAEAYRRQYGFNAVVLVPGNLYGPFDNFDLRNSHVIPALIRKIYEARLKGAEEIVMWGTGKPVRDFIYVEDACEAILQAMVNYNGSDLINISSGVPVTIRELVETTAALCGYQGRVRWDTSKTDGQMLKGYDVSRMREWLAYNPPTTLREGLRKTIAWFEANYASARLEVGV
ncbi:MAG TPA: GDP-L-fucose synthase [Candidatus Acidoferrum sp.]|nr:GDP-L-fucose synthase [Candidatus Acidoferrum sp.]